jgi:hypothetical protein
MIDDAGEIIRVSREVFGDIGETRWVPREVFGGCHHLLDVVGGLAPIDRQIPALGRNLLCGGRCTERRRRQLFSTVREVGRIGRAVLCAPRRFRRPSGSWPRTRRGTRILSAEHPRSVADRVLPVTQSLVWAVGSRDAPADRHSGVPRDVWAAGGQHEPVGKRYVQAAKRMVTAAGCCDDGAACAYCSQTVTYMPQRGDPTGCRARSRRRMLVAARWTFAPVGDGAIARGRMLAALPRRAVCEAARSRSVAAENARARTHRTAAAAQTANAPQATSRKF